ncbi:MAG: LCP family protein [Clostridia bacterium]|nr:LCP family protein [Clostridia bacterium]
MNTNNKNKNNDKISQRSVLFITLGILAILVLLVVLFLSTYKPASLENDATSDVTTTDSTPVNVDPTARKKGYYTFLLAGVDNVSNSTDVLMLVSLDAVNHIINVVSVPRDTYINKSVGGYLNITRINSIYAAAYNHEIGIGTRSSSAKHIAMKDLCRRLEENMGITIDYYMLVDTAAFRGIVDAVGGIYFDVPRDMDYDDEEQNLHIHLKAGYQLLDGAAAEGVVRFRKGYSQGDIDRVNVRAAFMKEMLKQVKEKLNIETTVKLIGELIGSVDTSLSLTQAVARARDVYAVPNENVKFITLSGSTVMNPANGMWIYYVLNRRGASNDINKYLNVLQSDIDDGAFDPRGFFTDSVNEENAYINEYYNS